MVLSLVPLCLGPFKVYSLGMRLLQQHSYIITQTRYDIMDAAINFDLITRIRRTGDTDKAIQRTLVSLFIVVTTELTCQSSGLPENDVRILICVTKDLEYIVLP